MVAVVAVVAVVTDVVVPDHPEPGSKVHTSLRSLQQSPFKVQNSSQKQATNAVPVCFTLSPQLPAHDAQGVKITSGVAGRKGASCVDPDRPDTPDPDDSKSHTSTTSAQQSPFKLQNSSQKHAAMAELGWSTLPPQ